MHVVQNYNNDILEGLAITDLPKSYILYFLVEKIGGCRSYFFLNLLEYNVLNRLICEKEKFTWHMHF
jgi:hypothetical protein